MPTRIVKIATPILIAGLLVFYGIRRAEDNPRAGPTCRIVIEVRWTELVEQQKAGKVDEANLEGLMKRRLAAPEQPGQCLTATYIRGES